MGTTLNEMIDEVTDNLKAEGVTELPSRGHMLRTLNRAKNALVDELELYDPDLFVYRKDYSVSSGDTYITLPDGSTEGEPAVRRILGLHKIEGSAEYKIDVTSRRSQGLHDYSGASFYMYPERNTLWFMTADGTGAAQDMTIRLRYSSYVPDLTLSDGDAEYDDIPENWIDLLLIRATLRLLPGGSGGRAKWEALLNGREAHMIRNAKSRVRTEPMRMRMDQDY